MGDAGWLSECVGGLGSTKRQFVGFGKGRVDGAELALVCGCCFGTISHGWAWWNGGIGLGMIYECMGRIRRDGHGIWTWARGSNRGLHGGRRLELDSSFVYLFLYPATLSRWISQCIDESLLQ